MRSPPTRPDDSPAKMPSFFASWETQRSLFGHCGRAGWLRRLTLEQRATASTGKVAVVDVCEAILVAAETEPHYPAERHISPDPATSHGTVTERASSRQQP